MKAPVGFRVKLLPSQTVPLFTEITGREKTVTATVPGCVLVQPAVLVPLTEKVVVTVGFTTGPPLI